MKISKNFIFVQCNKIGINDFLLKFYVLFIICWFIYFFLFYIVTNTCDVLNLYCFIIKNTTCKKIIIKTENSHEYFMN